VEKVIARVKAKVAEKLPNLRFEGKDGGGKTDGSGENDPERSKQQEDRMRLKIQTT